MSFDVEINLAADFAAYRESVNAAYDTLMESAAHAVIAQANAAVDEAIANDERDGLHDHISSIIYAAAEQIASTIDANTYEATFDGDSETEDERQMRRESLIESHRQHLLDNLDSGGGIVENFKQPQGGNWLVTDAGEYRCLSYVTAEDE